MIVLQVILLTSAFIFVRGCVVGVSDRSEFLVRSGDYCYFLADIQSTRENARTSCRNLNGSLATIRNEQTQREIYARALDIAETGIVTTYQFWFGARLSPENEVIWDSEERVSFSNLAENQQYISGSDCLVLTTDQGDGTGEWYTTDCSRGLWFFGYICEFHAPNSAVKTLNFGNILLFILISTSINVLM